MYMEPPLDMRENIAYYKAWQPKAHPPKPFAEYPKMPLVPHRWEKDVKNDDGIVVGKKGEFSGKAPVPIFDTFKQPIVFATARDEMEWLVDHPDEALQIAEVEASRVPATDKLIASNQALQAVTDRLQSAKAEIDDKDKQLADALAQLETAKLQLAAKRVADPAKLDMRTKEGREAAAAAKSASEG